MIVKDESHVIVDTLKNLAKYIKFDTYAISDTGSTDDTKALIKAFFDEQGISGDLFDDPWLNFGHNRSVAFQHAYQKTDYAFVWDADDRIHGTFKLPATLEADSYTFTFGAPGSTRYSRAQLFNNRKVWKYVGVLHEYPRCEEPTVGSPVGVAIGVVGPYWFESNRTGARNKDPLKYAKDAAILDKAFQEAVAAKDPLRHRYAYYCAQSYRSANNVPKAIEFYKQVLALEGNWVQERYNACIELYMMCEEQKKPEEGLHWLVESHKYDKTRVEGIYRLVQYYCIRNQPEVAFAYYSLIQEHYETHFRADLLQQYLFAKTTEYTFYLPYYMIIVADRVKRKEVGIRMIERIAREGFVAPTWWIHNVFTNLQFFFEALTPTTMVPFVHTLIQYVDRLRLQNIVLNSAHHVVLEKLIGVARPWLSAPIVLSKNRPGPRILLTFTTCKRWDLFQQTMYSIQRCWTDLDRVGAIVCVDDNSSEEDRVAMETTFPFIEYIWKGPDQKGHRQSMNIIYDLLCNRRPDYWIHMEDDWLFFKKEAYVTRAIEALTKYESQNVHQIVFNRNYGVVYTDMDRIGGTPLEPGLLLHQKVEGLVGKNCGYWPHYSLQPSLTRASAIRTLGNYDSPNRFFERDYADRYYVKGYRTAFFDTMCSVHIGKQHWETEGQNAYALNAVAQFGVKNEVVTPIVAVQNKPEPEPEPEPIPYPVLTGSMADHLTQFLALLEKKTPLGLIRPSDGEYSILKGETLTNCDKWTFQAGGQLQKDLAAAVQTIDPGLYIGIPCNTCNKPWNCYSAVHNDYMEAFNVQRAQRTYANLFMNANWPRFVEFLESYKQGFYVVGSGSVETTEVPIKGRHLIDPFLVDQWDLKKAEETARLLDFVKSKRGELILFSAGPLSKVWIPKCRKAHPSNLYVDVGAALDPFTKGPEVKSRFYTDRAHPFASEACVFREKRNLVYMCVFHNKVYVELLRLLLFSIQRSMCLESIDILVFTDRNIEPLVQGLSTLLGLPLKTHLLDGIASASASSAAKMRIFEYPQIYLYDRILYLDTDIIVQHDLAPLFTEPLEDRLYATEEGTIGESFHGSWFFNAEQAAKRTPAFNAGAFLFQNTPAMKRIMTETRQFMDLCISRKDRMPPCYEQPYMNYYFIKEDRQNTSFMKQYLELDHPTRPPPKPRAAMPLIHYICDETHQAKPKRQRMEIDLSKRLFDSHPATESRPSQLPAILGTTYRWDKGSLTFQEGGRLSTSWAQGTYRWLNLTSLLASWSGLDHRLFFEAGTTEFVSIRKGDCEMKRLTPLPTRALLYMCVFHNKDYIQLLSLLLQSIRFYSWPLAVDLLVLTSQEFEPSVQELNTIVPIRTLILPCSSIFEAACARLSVFDYETIGSYTKVLYLDTDILVKGSLQPLLDLPLLDKLYGLAQGSTDQPNFGAQFFGPGVPAVPGLNSGALLFTPSSTMRALFQKIRAHVADHQSKGTPVPYALDQPFINYHAIQNGLCDNQTLKTHVALFEETDTPEHEASAVVCHFSFPIGNFGHKYGRMKRYFQKILRNDTKRVCDVRGTYTWNKGFLRFVDEKAVQTTWGPGFWFSLDTNRVCVEWNKYYHILQFDASANSYFGIRVWPDDFTSCLGTKALPFDETVATPLCRIMGAHGSDKGSADITKSWHNYTTLYHSLLKDRRTEITRVFELGIGTTDVSIPNNMGPNGKPGASLRGWAEYFPQARIFGADIDKRILFEEGRIKTYHCDQLDRIAIRSMWLRADLQEGVDLLVDDGLHTYEANVCFFENSIHKVRKGGLYIIEDIHTTYLSQFQDQIGVWTQTYPGLTFDLVRLPSFVNRVDNTVLVVQA